jgi:hypothetical protein
MHFLAARCNSSGKITFLQLKHLEEELQKQEDINMQLLLKLENISLSPTATSSVMSPVTLTQETSLFAELEILSQSMSVSSFDSRPTGKVTIGMQVDAGEFFDLPKYNVG